MDQHLALGRPIKRIKDTSSDLFSIRSNVFRSSFEILRIKSMYESCFTGFLMCIATRTCVKCVQFPAHFCLPTQFQPNFHLFCISSFKDGNGCRVKVLIQFRPIFRPPKHLKSKGFSSVFRGYRKGKLA